MDFVLAVLNWNGREVLPFMLRSVIPQVVSLSGSIIVLDNASSDGSADDAEREFGNLSCFRLRRSSVNTGFAAGANMIIDGISSKYIVLANSDTVFSENSLLPLLEMLDCHEKAGLVGPLLLWPDGSLQPSLRDFPFPGGLIIEHIPFLRRYTARFSSHDRERKVDWLIGAVMAIRTLAFREAGGFDEDYYFYHEETDLQYRMKKHGWESWFTPNSKVIHHEGVAARQMYGRETYLQYIPAKLRFLRKHGYPGSMLMFRLYISFLQLARWSTGIVRPVMLKKDIRYTSSYCSKALSLTWKKKPVE